MDEHARSSLATLLPARERPAHGLTAQAGLLPVAAANRVKGFAILLMLAHHLFGLPTLIHSPNGYDPLLAGVPIEFVIGRFGKICVPLFLLLSGYGFGRVGALAGLSAAYAMRKAVRFLGTYDFYLAIVAVLALAAFPFSESGAIDAAEHRALVARLVPPALLTLGKPPIYEWWFAQTYLALVLLVPVLYRAMQSPRLTIPLALAAFCGGAAMDVAHLNPPLFSLSNLLIWQWPFCLGLLLARHADKQHMLSGFGTPRVAFIGAVLMAAGFAAIEWIAPAALAPFLIVSAPLALPLLIHAGNASPPLVRMGLDWIGRQSLPFWLIHPFLCIHFAQRWIYAPRLSLLVFLLLLLSTAALVVICERVRLVLASAILRLTGHPAGS